MSDKRRIDSKLDSVREHYAQIAQGSCCDIASGEALQIYAHELIDGIPQEALAASRGCADPVAKADLQPGEDVLDLGSGGGVDAIIASRLVGQTGHVFGLDMTPQMIELARNNASAANAANISFIEGRIEDIPLPDASVDVVISNCVINFSDDKRAVLAEARRVLRSGGRLIVSDIVGFEDIPEEAAGDLAIISGCTNGISPCENYERFLHEIGFERIQIEPKTIYTCAVLEEKALRKKHEAQLEHLKASSLYKQVDSITGSAIIYAWTSTEQD